MSAGPQWVDEFISAPTSKKGLGATPGYYGWFNRRFRRWVKAEKGVSLTYHDASMILQEHKWNMFGQKWAIRAAGRGAGTTWEVTLPPSAHDALVFKLDQLSMDYANDCRLRVRRIARGDATAEATAEAEIRATIAALNVARRSVGLPVIVADSIFNGSTGVTTAP